MLKIGNAAATAAAHWRGIDENYGQQCDVFCFIPCDGRRDDYRGHSAAHRLEAGLAVRSLTFTVPGRPMVQERPIVLRKGWAIDPKRSKQQKKVIAQYCVMAQRQGGWLILEGDVEVYMRFYGLRSNADISNAVKLVEDGLNKVAYLDDKQICLLTAERFTRFEGEPRTEVTLVPRQAPQSELPLAA